MQKLHMSWSWVMSFNYWLSKWKIKFEKYPFQNILAWKKIKFRKSISLRCSVDLLWEAWFDIGWIGYYWNINQREWSHTNDFYHYQFDVNKSCPDITSMSWNRSTEISILYYKGRENENCLRNMLLRHITTSEIISLTHLASHIFLLF